VGSHRNRRLLSLAAVFGAVLSLSCSGGVSEFPEVAGWSQPGEVLIYDTDTLWEYINGAAELFVEYGVQSCRTTDLSSGDLTVTVDLYEMGTPLNAYGVFSREYAGDALSIDGATAASISPPYQALLLKGSTYAKVNVFEGELTEAAGRELLQGLAQALPGETSLPAELDLLPSDGKVAGTEGYKPEAFMGLVELTDCLYAEYSLGGEEQWQGFVVLPEAAAAVWQGLSAEWTSMEIGSLPVFYREVPYLGFMGVVRTDAGLFGVSGAADEAGLRERLGRFVP
jgi:hypothetical protein